MFAQLTHYIATYGYFAVFCIVVLLELGMPGLPNELVLFYFGYISHKAGLFFPAVIITGIVADITGSFLLYLLFYYGRGRLVHLKPGWLRPPAKKIDSLTQKLLSHKGRNLFVAKMTPFIRGYVAVVAGLLHIPPSLYTRLIVITAIAWTGGWLAAGWLWQTWQNG